MSLSRAPGFSRRWLSSLLALALALVGTVAVSPGAEAATTRHAVSVSLKVSAAKVKSGKVVTISGVVKDKVTKKAVRGARVVIQQRLTGAKKWTTVATRKTNKKGAYSAKVRENLSVSVRAVVKATKKTKSKTSALKRITATQSIAQVSRVDVRPTRENQNGYTKVVYQASPGLRGTTVFEQYKEYGATFTAKQGIKVPANGRFAMTFAWRCAEVDFSMWMTSLVAPGRTEIRSPVVNHYAILCDRPDDYRTSPE